MKSIFILFYLLLPAISWAINCEKLPLRKMYNPENANFFNIAYYDNYKILSAKNYKFLIKKVGIKLNCEFDFILNENPQSFAFTSTTYLPTVELLSLQKNLKAFQGKKYIYSRKINDLNLIDLGFDLNLEVLLKNKIQMTLAYEDNISNRSTLSKYYKLGTPIVFNFDYLENSALGRSEWIVFNSTLFGREQEGIEEFKKIKNHYLKITNLNLSGPRKRVLVGHIENGAWVTPGGRSSFAKLIKDAGGDLVLFVDSDKTQYLNLEEVQKKISNVDVWLINTNSKTYNSNLSNFIYQKINQVKKYNYIKRNDIESNDFWESAQTYSNLLLLDLNNILNDKIDNLIWYKKI